MSEHGNFVSRLSMGQRWSLGLGVLVILVVVATLGWWLLRPSKAVLFSDLGEADAGVIVSELDKLKQPHELGEDGRSILVPQDAVHKTRMALMAKPLPLHGAVGFELFNNSEFGVSDFVQKVNYQRALQGELTRTILSIEDVQSARVHLALPDQALFRKDGPKAKASVTLTMRPGSRLQPLQVSGIQRLIAASVAEVKSDDVTVVDQHGEVLSRVSGDDSGASVAQLDSRQSLEKHLSRKAAAVLDRMFKPGEALVTVDVVLNHKHTKVVTEQVLPGAPAQKDQTPTGVIVRERSSTRDNGSDARQSNVSSATVTTQEVDYQTGKRTEHVTSVGGELARLHVAVVVRSALTDVEMARVKSVIGAAVGLNLTRGDHIEVYASPATMQAQGGESEAASKSEPSLSGSKPADDAKVIQAPQHSGVQLAWVYAGLMAMVVMAAVLYHLRSLRVAAPAAARQLTNDEREAMLRTLQQWLLARDGQA